MLIASNIIFLKAILESSCLQFDDFAGKRFVTLCLPPPQECLSCLTCKEKKVWIVLFRQNFGSKMMLFVLLAAPTLPKMIVMWVCVLLLCANNNATTKGERKSLAWERENFDCFLLRSLALSLSLLRAKLHVRKLSLYFQFLPAFGVKVSN